MLTRCFAVSTSSGIPGAQIVCSPKEQGSVSWSCVEAGILRNSKFMSNARTAVAVQMVESPEGDGFPTPSSWEVSAPVRFHANWQGKNPDPERETEVRLLWTSEWLSERFPASLRDILDTAGAWPKARRDSACDRSVAAI